jgi:predicted membrane GTPase involved in stress response
MGETDSADKFMVFGRVFTCLFLLKQWEEKGMKQIGQPQVIIKEIDGKNVSQLRN